MNYHSSTCCLQKTEAPGPDSGPAFQPVALEDKTWIDRLIRLEDSPSADWNFTNIFVWDDTYHQQVARLGDRLLIRLMYHGTPFYGFPIGQGDLNPAIETLHEDVKHYHIPLQIRGVTEKNRAELEAAYPGKFTFTEDSYAYDYIYEAEKLSTLAGKKLHGKRNHINRFIEENPGWSFEPLTPENLPACVEMNREWARRNEDHSNFSNELMALDRVFRHFDALKLEGGLLRLDGQVIAYTIGEPLNSDTFIVHFEKAFSEIQGAYPMINREFARHIVETYPQLRYINREDDMGIENLRRAKRSYYPVKMVEKYTATWGEKP